ncbi:Hypothetical Protein FCC1311_058092 [Hondaea fermentalgiana]|uniref:Uncharacterized protein n=1 Tax=Hondaea fermentalgiana TaxID=2315210 RepID=A0A2R5GIN5_9STRA|nr:Hypothetical Protein FCC1311_058092 [Hondaea fermentalgiana]|eukprot:GBG29588.1 Hypothetical Protein FCC1311_058092 [Hondaea fermentalgiana]
MDDPETILEKEANFDVQNTKASLLRLADAAHILEHEPVDVLVRVLVKHAAALGEPDADALATRLREDARFRGTLGDLKAHGDVYAMLDSATQPRPVVAPEETALELWRAAVGASDPLAAVAATCEGNTGRPSGLARFLRDHDGVLGALDDATLERGLRSPYFSRARTLAQLHARGDLLGRLRSICRVRSLVKVGGATVPFEEAAAGAQLPAGATFLRAAEGRAVVRVPGRAGPEYFSISLSKAVARKPRLRPCCRHGLECRMCEFGPKALAEALGVPGDLAPEYVRGDRLYLRKGSSLQVIPCAGGELRSVCKHGNRPSDCLLCPHRGCRHSASLSRGLCFECQAERLRGSAEFERSGDVFFARAKRWKYKYTKTPQGGFSRTKIG